MGKRKGGHRGKERAKETKSQASPLEDLLRQVREINPTGRGLSPKDCEQRYQKKSALQSELIQRFGHDLDVIGKPEDAVVSLRTKTLGRDACHAVVEELSDEARAWIRRKLDEASQGAKGANPLDATLTLEPLDEDARDEMGDWAEATVDALLAGGRAAVAQFDFDLGLRLMKRAFEESRGKLIVSREYLELLVDQLGMDDEAQGLEPRLAAEALADQDVRVLLAVSAARTGDPSSALRWLANLQHPRVAEVLAQLAQVEVKAGRIPEALRMAQQLESVDPAHPVVREVAAWVEERRAELRAPAEREIQKLATSGDFVSAARAARNLLESDPDSSTARRLLSESEAQLRERSAASLLASARAAADHGELLEAIALLRKIQTLKVADTTTREVAQLLKTLETSLARNKSEAEVERVCGLLDHEDPSAGLLAYIALADSEREGVRARRADVALSWLEEMSVAAKQRSAAVQAVLCLRAVFRSRESDPEAFLRAVSTHDLLRRVADCRTGIAYAQGILRDQREREALNVLAEARACLESGDPSQAASFLESLSVQDLPPTDKDALHALNDLRVEVEEARRRRRWNEKYQQLLQDGKWLEARDIAFEASQVDPEPWTDRAEAMQQKLHEAWHLRVDRTPSAVPVPMPELDSLHFRDGSLPLLTLDGERVVLRRTASDWTFLTVVRLADGAILERVMLQTPSVMDFADGFLLGDDLWVVSEDALLVLSVEDWRVKRWVDFHPRFSQEGEVEIQLAPDRVHVWVDVLRKGYSVAYIVNLETGAVIPLRESNDSFFALWGSSTPSVVVSKFDGPTIFADCRGKPLMSAINAIQTCIAATVMPSGSGFVAVGGFDEIEELFVVASAGETPFVYPLKGFDVETGVCTMGVSSEQGLVYFCGRNLEGDWELCAFRIGEAGIEQVYRKAVSPGWSVVMAADATRAVLLSTSGGVVRAVSLGAAEPSVPKSEAPRRTMIPSSEYFIGCALHETDSEVEELSQRFRLSHDVKGAVEAYERDFAEDPDSLWKLPAAVSTMVLPIVISLPKRIAERHPGHPISRCVLAERVLPEDPGRVVELLEMLNPDSLPTGYRCHREHLLGIAHLLLGNFGRAREALEKVREFPEPRCNVEEWLVMLQEVELPLPADWWDQERSGIEKLMGGIAQADVHLARGEALEAWRVLDQPLVWGSGEQQSIARLAEAGMACCDAGQMDVFRVVPIVVLVTAKERWGSLQIPNRWDEARMQELAQRGQRWLDRVLEN